MKNGKTERKTERRKEGKKERERGRKKEGQTRPFRAISTCSLDSLNLHPLAEHEDGQHCLSWDKEQ